MSSFRSSVLFACFAAVLAAGSLSAFQPPADSEIQQKAFSAPELYISNVLLPATDPNAGFAASGLATLGVNPEQAYLDTRSGTWGTLMPATPLIPGDGVGNGLAWSSLRASAPADASEMRTAVWEAFHSYLTTHRSALGIDPSEVRRGKVTIQEDGDFVQIYGRREIGGVPVRDSFVKATVSHGNLILFGFVKWGAAPSSAIAGMDSEQARASVASHLGGLAARARWGKSELVFVPTSRGAWSSFAAGAGYDLRLVWALRSKIEGDHGDWEALVDASSGEVLAFQDRNHYGVTQKRAVHGGVFPVANDGEGSEGVEQIYPMPFLSVDIGGETDTTDAGGYAYCRDGNINTALEGPYLRMADQCGTIDETEATPNLNLGKSNVIDGADCTVPGIADSPGNTAASRTGFYELGQLIEMARGQLPENNWLDQQLTANMNIPMSCNAFFGAGGTVNFYRSGGPCTNTGEIAGVFDHEWGHGMDANDATPGISSPGEGIADIYATLRLNTSCIGRNFQLGSNCGGYGDPCLDCDGVRDIDATMRASGQPHTLTWIDQNCPVGQTNGPCGSSVHCEGAVYAEALWELYTDDLQTVYGMDLNTAREVATRLTYLGAGGVGNWFTCLGNGSGTGDGCNADGGYLNYIAADDDNGTLADGTPHMEAIFDAFDRQGIACGTPAVQDGGCADTPTTAPTAVATAIGNGVRLTWNAVANASSYRIYRTEGEFACDFGKQLIAEVDGLTYDDVGLRTGRNYSYNVIPMGATASCFGPASPCATAAPIEGGALLVEDGFEYTIDTGDSDAFLDNCEMSTVDFDVSNNGAVALTNVRIVEVRSPSHPMLDTFSFPASFAANIATCSSAPASFSFVADGLSHDDVLVLEVDVTANELAGGVRTTTLTIGSTESDLSDPIATRTFDFETDFEGWSNTEGTFDRTDRGSGNAGDGTQFSVDSSTLVNNACDRARSPLVILEPTSTLSLWNSYDIEDQSGGSWYDRANVAVVGIDGSRTVVEPDGGRTYNADSSGPGTYSGCNEPEMGWAGENLPFGQSTWTATALESASLAGDFVQVEVTYATDGALAEAGFAFDQVTLTNVRIQVADEGSDDCSSIFTDGFESGDTTSWN